MDLFWIPLGAGGVGYVRINGRIYEGITAAIERRPSKHLYHTALEIRHAEERFTIENAWPSPDADVAARGVVFEGPVFSRSLSRFRAFRYEVRRWSDGVIPDAAEAVGGPRLISTKPAVAGYLLGLVESVPALVWGRDELAAGEMWNSNSVISYLLASAGIPAEAMEPPAGGRAPGWRAGLVAAGRRGLDGLVRLR